MKTDNTFSFRDLKDLDFDTLAKVVKLLGNTKREMATRDPEGGVVHITGPFIEEWINIEPVLLDGASKVEMMTIEGFETFVSEVYDHMSAIMGKRQLKVHISDSYKLKSLSTVSSKNLLNLVSHLTSIHGMMLSQLGDDTKLEDLDVSPMAGIIPFAGTLFEQWADVTVQSPEMLVGILAHAVEGVQAELDSRGNVAERPQADIHPAHTHVNGLMFDIAGNMVSLAELREDIQAARDKGIGYNELAFTTATVQALLDHIVCSQPRHPYAFEDRVLDADNLRWYLSNLVEPDDEGKFNMAVIVAQTVLQIPEHSQSRTEMSDTAYVNFLIAGLKMHIAFLERGRNGIGQVLPNIPEKEPATPADMQAFDEFVSVDHIATRKAHQLLAYMTAQPKTKLDTDGAIIGDVYAPTPILITASSMLIEARSLALKSSKETGVKDPFYALTAELLIMNGLLGLKEFNNENVLGEVEVRLNAVRMLLEKRKGFSREK